MSNNRTRCRYYHLFYLLSSDRSLEEFSFYISELESAVSTSLFRVSESTKTFRDQLGVFKVVLSGIRVAVLGR